MKCYEISEWGVSVSATVFCWSVVSTESKYFLQNITQHWKLFFSYFQSCQFSAFWIKFSVSYATIKTSTTKSIFVFNDMTENLEWSVVMLLTLKKQRVSFSINITWLKFTMFNILNIKACLFTTGENSLFHSLWNPTKVRNASQGWIQIHMFLDSQVSLLTV